VRSRLGRIHDVARRSWHFVAAGAARRTRSTKRHRDIVLQRALRRGAPEARYPVTMLVVARSRNAHQVKALARQFAVTDLRVWGLDGPIEALRPHTVGTGPGQKFELLNRLYEASPIPGDHWIVVADDDVVLSRGTGQKLIQIGARARFDLFQPGHSLSSLYIHTFLVGRPAVRADLVTFVEIGPLFVVAPSKRGTFLPFPDGVGMGYGLELQWWKHQSEGGRLGLISQCRMVHLSPVGALYEVGEEKERLRRALADAGLSDLGASLENRGRWWRWSANPPWL
jgi:hypothetical protein